MKTIYFLQKYIERPISGLFGFRMTANMKHEYFRKTGVIFFSWFKNVYPDTATSRGEQGSHLCGLRLRIDK